ncbi:MAG: zinc metallopeptidase [Verrucomicrobiales bacterium]|nr:zinc metallopeptidase [Verrucomicrobiales bacterium]
MIVLAQQLAPVPTFDPVYLILTGGAMLVSWLVGAMLQRRFREYSQMPVRMTGAQIAQKMLDDNGIHDVQVISTPGQLTDHYNPLNKTVNLSEVVYHENNVAAAAVAAHECGHAIQHARAYAPLKMRSALVPMVSFASHWVQYILIFGLILASSGSGNVTVLFIGVVLFALTTLFSVITLPVEFDASRRALVWLDSSRTLANVEHDKAKNALFWAAMTYTVAAIASIGQLLYYVFRLLEARR